MRSFIYRLHIWLGLIVAIPVLAWASSGLLYAWPGAVEGGKIETIDATRVRLLPSEALVRASEFAGGRLPTTALTLLMRDGRPVYQAIGGMGADSRGVFTVELKYATAERFDPVLSPGPFLFFCRFVAGSSADSSCGAGEYLSRVRSLFEFDAPVCETVQAKQVDANISLQCRNRVRRRAPVILVAVRLATGARIHLSDVRGQHRSFEERGRIYRTPGSYSEFAGL